MRCYIGLKRLILLSLLVVLSIWIWFNYRNGAFSPIMIEQFRNEYPILSVIVFILIYAISVISILPSLPLNLAAGFLWGGILGGIYSTIGVTFGGYISFLIARLLIGQPLAKQFENKWVVKVQKEFERNGWKFVAFARLNPVIPTGPLNYLLGITVLSSKDFLWTTFVFILPPAIAVSYIGDSLQTFVSQDKNVHEMLQKVMTVSAAITFLVVIKFAAKIYKKNKIKLGKEISNNRSNNLL